MGLSFDNSNKMFFFLGVVFELWFILMYALDYGYIFNSAGTTVQEIAFGFLSTQGFLMVLFLLLLFFLGSIILTQDLPLSTPTSLDPPTHPHSSLSSSSSSPSNTTSLLEVSGSESVSEMTTTPIHWAVDLIILSISTPMTPD